MTNTDYRALEQQFSLNLYAKRDAVIVRGQGATLFDQQGREYIDCAAGIGVANTGHCHPQIVAAMQRQAENLTVVANTLYNDQRSQLLAQLIKVTPAHLTRAFLCNSGAEANEAALKFARLATGRTGFVTAMRGFHGRTMGAVSATFTKSYRQPFDPLIPGFSYVPLNKIEKMDAAINDSTAAVMLELVQGEGGVNIANPEYIAAVRKLCDERGALLIIDEIQTGMCRTGKFLACEHYELAADIVTLAKAIASGIPMGATLVTDRIQLAPGLHGTTFGGNPMACAAALATLNVMHSEQLAQRAQALGDYFAQQLGSKPLSQLRELRQMGLMIGMELKSRAQPVLEALMERGIIALPAGATVVRLLPPLVISESLLDTVVGHLHELLA